MSTRVIFMGSPDFAIPALQALIDSSFEVVAVYCQPPRPAGRGHKLTKGPVHQLAESHDIPVRYPTSLKGEAEQQEFAAFNADFAVVAAYGLLLPQAILDAPKHGCINIHPSDLPRWRGAAPLQHTIMAGDTHTAMCIMQMDAGLDTGDVLLRHPVSLNDSITAGQLHDDMATLGATCLMEVLEHYDTLTPHPQEGEATYASKLTPENCHLDFTQTAAQICNTIRGLNPFPAARFDFRGEACKAYVAEAAEPSDDPLTFACADGAVRITQLQRPGKARMSAEDFLRGLRA